MPHTAKRPNFKTQLAYFATKSPLGYIMADVLAGMPAELAKDVVLMPAETQDNDGVTCYVPGTQDPLTALRLLDELYPKEAEKVQTRALNIRWQKVERRGYFFYVPKTQKVTPKWIDRALARDNSLLESEAAWLPNDAVECGLRSDNAAGDVHFVMG